MQNPSQIRYSKLIFVFVILFTGITSVPSQTYKTVDEAEGLLPGTKAPAFTATDTDGKDYSLEEALAKGPVVMIFYRGYWCPHCNRHLAGIQDSLGFIYEKGASIIAVSPEKPEYLNETKEITGSEFTLLYDEGYRIANAYDVSFLPAQRKLMKYNTFTKASLKESHSDESQRLPIPATYIINTEGLITWRQFDPNYKNRSTVKEIIQALSEIQLENDSK